MAKIELPILQIKQNSNNIDEEEVTVVCFCAFPILVYMIIQVKFIFQSTLESLGYGTHFIDLSNEIGSKSLTFNEDFNLRPWWTPTYDKNYLLG